MTHQSSSEPTIANLTREQLEEIIEEIAEKTIRQQMETKTETDRDRLMAIFGTWQDERSAVEIIEEIYESRDRN